MHPFVLSDSDWLHLPVSVPESGPCRCVVRELRVDVRVRSGGERPARVVGFVVLLSSRVSRSRAAVPVRLGLGRKLHNDSTWATAVQSHAVLLGCVRPRGWPRVTPRHERLLPTATATGMASLHGWQRLADHEPHDTHTHTGRVTWRHLRLLGHTANIPVTAKNMIFLVFFFSFPVQISKRTLENQNDFK